MWNFVYEYANTMSSSDYISIKRSILSTPCNKATLEVLKNEFKEDIRSKRSFDKINSLLDLINILEKRDILNDENIEAILKIRNIISPQYSVIIPNTNDHQSHNHNLENIFTPPEVNRLSCSNNLNFGKSRVLCDEEAKRRVYKVISTEIGRKWKDFGRALNIHEHILDELDDTCVRTSEKIYKILHIVEDECDQRYWKSTLLDGLCTARRKDLKQKIQNIFDMYNIR